MRWWPLAVVLLSCGARSGLELAPPEHVGVPLDASRPDASGLDGALQRDAPAPMPDASTDAPMTDSPRPDPCGVPGTWVEWESPTSEDLHDVIVAGDDALIVGANGTLLRWDGVAWRPEESATRESIAAIWIDGRGAGWFTSSTGLSRLEGEGWRSQPRPPLGPISVLLAVWGRAPDDVWFGGGSVTPRVGLHAHWDGRVVALVDDEPTGVQVTDLHGSEDERAIWSVSQAGHVARTVDGGPWGSIPDAEGEVATSVWAPGADEAWFPAHGEVHHWIAGRWERFVVPGDARYYYTAWGSSSTDVWVAGNGGAAAHFDGALWTQMTLPTAVTMVAIDGRCATDAWMVGGSGTILRLVAAP